MPAESSVRGDSIATTQSGAGLWRALAFALLGLFVFVLIFNLLLPSLGSDLPPMALVAVGLLMALIPAALWLTFFYAFDRRAPEPKSMVVTVFAGAAVLCAALRDPFLAVLGGTTGIDGGVDSPWWSRLALGVLVVGVLEMALIYLAVRVLAFNRSEFDERVDGVIYGVAAGLGVATVINFGYVIAHGGVDLDTGSVRMVINTLAYASAAGVIGYFIGQARFERVPWHYLPAGLLLAATLDGALFFALEPPVTALHPREPWLDLLLATAVAVLALVAVFVLVARANEETERIARGAPRPLPARPATRPWLPSRDPFGAAPIAASHTPSDREIGDPAPEAESPPDAFGDGSPRPISTLPEKGNPYGAD